MGAFVAGLVVSQSGFAHQAIRETEALRNAFMAAFFVSIGLLFDPAGAGDELGLLILLLVSVTVLKLAVTVGFARLAGLGFTAALPLALLLANAGEFSFVVVEVADDEVLGEGARQAMYFSVIVSLLLTSLLTAVISRGRDAGPVIPRRDSVVVIGYGGLGRAAAEELARRGIPHVVVESDGELAHLARTDGHPAVWGDARQRSVLRQLGPYATFLLTVRGDAASQLVEELANVAPGSRVLSQAIPTGAAREPRPRPHPTRRRLRRQRAHGRRRGVGSSNAAGALRRPDACRGVPGGGTGRAPAAHPPRPPPRTDVRATRTRR